MNKDKRYHSIWDLKHDYFYLSIMGMLNTHEIRRKKYDVTQERYKDKYRDNIDSVSWTNRYMEYVNGIEELNE